MSSSPPLKPDDLSFSDLSLLTTPPSKSAPKGNASKSSSSILSHPHVSSQDRAGASQRSAAGASSSVESSLRMLQGVTQSTSSGAPPVSGRNRGPNDGNKRRASLFAPSAIPKRDNADSISTAQRSERAGGLEEEGEDSLLQAMQTPNGKAAPVAVPTLPSSFTRKAQGSTLSEAAHDATSSDATDGSQQAETKEQVQRQFDELSRMNATFSAYERMLQGTAGQIELFSHRLSCTSELLSSYIDLLLRSSDHQSLLLSPSWQGQTSDYERHVAELAQLEEELERRRRQREEEEQREEMELRKRMASTQTNSSKSGVAGARGRGRATISSSSRGAPRGRMGTVPGAGATERTAPSMSGRGRTVVSTSRIDSNSTSASRGRGGAGVSRPSGIPGPSTRGR